MLRNSRVFSFKYRMSFVNDSSANQWLNIQSKHSKLINTFLFQFIYFLFCPFWLYDFL